MLYLVDSACTCVCLGQCSTIQMSRNVSAQTCHQVTRRVWGSVMLQTRSVVMNVEKLSGFDDCELENKGESSETDFSDQGDIT